MTETETGTVDPQSARDRNGRYAAALILALWVLAQLPFLPTALRVDETNIVRIAERIAAEPSDPYGFYINWGGLDEEAFHILANPPGLPYWLALWGSTFGWHEWIIHLAMLPFGAIALVAIGWLARELGVEAPVSMILTIASPAFVLAAQVAMPDIAMLAAFLIALAAAMSYRRSGRMWLVPLGCTAGALSPLLKYNGALVGPLLLLIWIYGARRRRGLFLIMSGPAIGLAAWSWWSLMNYGRAHVLAMVEFQSSGAVNILTGVLGHFGLGVVPLAVALMRSPGPLSNASLNLVTGLSTLLMTVGAHLILNVGPIASLAYGASAAIGFRFAIVAVLVAVRARQGRALTDVLTIGWIALMVWFQFGLLFSSVRYLLPLLPAVILLALRHELVDVRRMNVKTTVGACVVLSFAVAIGDARGANLYRTFVQEVMKPEASRIDGRLYFDGHWGFQYYMEAIGGEAVNVYRQPRWRAGDVLVLARVPDPSYDFPTPSRSIEFESREYRLSPEWPVRTIDCGAWSNFYGPGLRNCRGAALPFGFSREANDVITIYRARSRDAEAADAFLDSGGGSAPE